MEVQLAVREISAPVSVCSSGYSLFWLKRGECAVQTPKGCFEAGCGDAFLLQPDGLYTISPKTEARLYRVDFHREAFLRACLPALKGCPLLVSFFVHNSVRSDMAFLHFHGVSPEIGALLCTMNREFEEKGAYYQTILLCSLINLLLQLSRNCRIDTTANEPPAGQLLQRLMEYLVSHADGVTFGGMAEAFYYLSSEHHRGCAEEGHREKLFAAGAADAHEQRRAAAALQPPSGGRNRRALRVRQHKLFLHAVPSVFRHDAGRICGKEQRAGEGGNEKAELRGTESVF